MDDVSTKVTPGLGGFLAFFLLALVLWLLMRNMNGRLRRMRYREEQAAAAARVPEAPTTAPLTEMPAAPQTEMPTAPAVRVNRPGRAGPSGRPPRSGPRRRRP